MGVWEPVALLQGLRAINLRWVPKGVRDGPGGRGRALERNEETHPIHLLVDPIALPDPVEVPADHGSRTVGGGSRRGTKRMRNDG